MICMRPTPPSHETTVDCQLLSAHANAFMRFAGTVITGRSPTRPGGRCTPTQYCLLPAATSAALTSVADASGPGCLVQVGLSATGGGGAGGTCAAADFADAVGLGTAFLVGLGAGVLAGVVGGADVGAAVCGGGALVVVADVGRPAAARFACAECGPMSDQPSVAVAATSANAPDTAAAGFTRSHLMSGSSPVAAQTTLPGAVPTLRTHRDVRLRLRGLADADRLGWFQASGAAASVVVRKGE